MTLTGLFALLVAYMVIATYLPDFENPAPRWLYFLAGSSVLFYLHMDALDGKQARRTRTSSPLGQLFDHGCDALAVHFILVALITSLQLRHEWRAVVGMLYVFIPWWMAHWEEYHTGVMVYGSGLWGVTEANYAVVLLHYYTFLLGPRGWTTKPLAWALAKAPRVLPDAAERFFTSLQINELLLLVFGIMGLGLFLEQVYRVFRLTGTRLLERTTLPIEERGSKSLGHAAAASHLLQILLTCACGGLLLALPVHVSGQSRVVMATFGVTYALQSTRMIMAHMSKEPFSIALWPIILMLTQIGNQFLKLANPVLLAYAVNVVVVAGYLHYVIGVIGEICAFLGIKALVIKPAVD